MVLLVLVSGRILILGLLLHVLQELVVCLDKTHEL